MKKKSFGFIALDVLYIAMMLLPILAAIVLKVLTTPLSNGVEIMGARIFFTVPMPIQDLIVSEAQINSLCVMIALSGLCLFLTHGLKTRNISIRQHLSEWIVEKVDKLVKESMGEYFMGFVPFIIAIFGLSAFSSFMSLVGLFPPTSDINIVGGWALLVFFLITYYKMKCGPLSYLKGFAQPVAFLAPINFISEFATPISMAFRHYGNVLSGSVIAVLLATAFQGLSNLLLGWLPGFLGEFPFLQIGIPAILSAYFDVFSGGLQAFIFAMLTMMYVSDGFSIDEYFTRKAAKQNKKSASK